LGDGINSPLYGPSPRRDALVQALMSGIDRPPQTSDGGSGIAGLNPMMLAQMLNQPAPYTGNANGGTYSYGADGLFSPGAGYTFQSPNGNVSTVSGSLGDFKY
jgi:hypothetical protein